MALRDFGRKTASKLKTNTSGFADKNIVRSKDAIMSGINRLMKADFMQNTVIYSKDGKVSGLSQPILDSDNREKATSNPIVKSLFNPIHGIGANQYIQVRNNAPLIDGPNMRKQMRETSDCSVKGLCEASKKNQLGRMVYNYSDFMYCKYLGKVPNNYMVTLRRFAFPCGDHINYTDPFDPSHDRNRDTEKHAPDMGRLITWMGTPGNDMSEILKYKVKMPFVEMTSKYEEGGDAGGENGGPLGTFLNATANKNYQQQMLAGYAGSSAFKYMGGLSKGMGKYFGGSEPPYRGNLRFMDSNKTYGPLDVIITTNRRDTGLLFEQGIKLVFDYELRSYNGINPKAAFLDLLANILAVTYATGSFWGGAYRCTGASQSNVFANLPIFKINGNDSYSDMVQKAVDSGKSIWKSLSGEGEFSLRGIMAAAQKILSGGIATMIGAGLNKLGRPQKNAVNSLLSPAPVGFWHITIGNPWHPIMMMGNMILEDAEIEHYGPLGLDDFPTGLKVTCSLKPGKGRDSSMIEQMYMMGESRIYTPGGNEILELFDSSESTKKESSRLKTQWEERVKQENEKNKKKKSGSDFADKASSTAQQAASSTDSVESTAGTYNNVMGAFSASSDLSISAERATLRDKLRYFFGTEDTETIVHVAREGSFGDKPGKKKTPDSE